jgi:hypothetical protein
VLKCILHGRWFSLEGCLLGKLVGLHMVEEGLVRIARCESTPLRYGSEEYKITIGLCVDGKIS